MDSKDIILLLLASNKKSLVGTTRLQKFLFLLQKEKRLMPEEGDLTFEAYKFGPASKALYDDLIFLVNMGYMTKSDDKEKLGDLEIGDIEDYSASMFLSGKGAGNGSNDCENDNKSTLTYDSVVYNITEEGIEYLKKNKIIDTLDHQKVQDITKKYGNYSLTSLLQYVYRNYPEYTDESEIKNDIL